MNRNAAVALGAATMMLVAGPALVSGATGGTPTGDGGGVVALDTTYYWNSLPDWSKKTRYTPGTVVRYGSKAWQATKSGKNHKPKSSSSYWVQVYAVGQPGTGATGPAGPTGATGATGPTGPSAAFQATNAAVVVIGAANTQVVSLPLAGGSYVVSASAVLQTTVFSPRTMFCELADGNCTVYAPITWAATDPGFPVTARWTANTSLAVTVPAVVGASVQLMCRTTVAGVQTTGTAVIHATHVASLG